jgi:hypothetical protein
MHNISYYTVFNQDHGLTSTDLVNHRTQVTFYFSLIKLPQLLVTEMIFSKVEVLDFHAIRVTGFFIQSKLPSVEKSYTFQYYYIVFFKKRSTTNNISTTPAIVTTLSKTIHRKEGILGIKMVKYFTITVQKSPILNSFFLK